MALDWRSRIRVIGLRQVVPLQRNDSVTMDGFCDTDGQSPGRERREEGERGGGGGGGWPISYGCTVPLTEIQREGNSSRKRRCR